MSISKLIPIVAALIAVPVVIATALGGNNAEAKDRGYLSRLATPAHDSASVGNTFSDLLTRHQMTRSVLVSSLATLLQRQQQDLAAAAALSPAPTLRSEQQPALDALGLRVAGLQGLDAVLRGDGTAAELSAWAERLLTSDVVWRDVFQRSTRAQLARDRVAGMRVPASTFLRDPDLAGSAAMASLLARLRHSSPQQAGVLKLGLTGPSVSAWQRELNRWLAGQAGERKLTVNGTFDQATEAATVRLQRAERIGADGVVGPVTRAALARALTR